ncbi:myb-like protein X [Clytia hemisphaerica]|uniref:SCP domain-containing protein n=1 Tax=Clytia hemisphaerica TaxID=252671 RepID=A0A7M5X1C2_9CNID
MSSEDHNHTSSREVTSTTTTTDDDGTLHTVTTTSTTENDNGDVTSCSKLSKELGDATNNNETSTTTTTTEKTECSGPNCGSTASADGLTSSTMARTQMETVKSLTQNGDSKIEEVKTECSKVVNTVNDQVSTTEKTIKEETKKIENKVENIEKDAENVAKDVEKGAENAIKNAENEAGKVKNELGKEVDQAKDKVSEAANNLAGKRNFEAAGPGFKAPLTITLGEEEEALYALNKVRSLHGVQPIVWDKELETQAKDWALKLGEAGQWAADLSGTQSVGEIVYVAKGTSECSRMSTAVHEWYKSIAKYDFNNTNMIPPGDESQPFTQLVWKSATKVGMSAVYREDTKTSYLVVQFTPPGNYGDVRNYWKYVTPPLAGTTPLKIPKPEELLSTDSNQASSISNMGSIIGVLCHWCVSNGDKPEIKTAAARPYIKITVTDEDKQQEEGEGKKDRSADAKKSVPTTEL